VTCWLSPNAVLYCRDRLGSFSCSFLSFFRSFSSCRRYCFAFSSSLALDLLRSAPLPISRCCEWLEFPFCLRHMVCGKIRLGL